MKKAITPEYKEDVNTLRRWSKAYHMNKKPMVSDEEYDALFDKVKEYEKKNKIVNDDSPTQIKKG